MKSIRFVALAACLIPLQAHGRGVSPYLPLNLDPQIERQIERLLILADKPVLTRPIAAATVLDALEHSCRSEPALCREIRGYLRRYMQGWGLTDASIEVSTADGAEEALPNRRGLTTASDWSVSARGFWQPSDYALVSLGAVSDEHETIPDGSLVSLGWNRAQLDIGYRPHWLSPMTDSAMLISTQAATMPSITLSSYDPLTRFGIHYEVFAAAMSHSDRILFGGEDTSGRPHLSGVHLSMEPAQGWALGVNRLLQYGGGERPGSFSDLLKAFFSPSRYDNTNPNLTSDQQFGNQVASITSEFLFPGPTPFSVYFEYAGEDTSNGNNLLLGNSALSAGIHWPRLWQRFDLTYEASEWQNEWYVNSVYGDGLTNRGHVIGHWAGDDRQFGNAVGGRSQMLRLGWDPSFGGTLDLRYRTLSNQDYFGVHYDRGYDVTLTYSRSFGLFTLGGEVFAGRDAFGEGVSRLAAFVRYAPQDSAPPSFDDTDDEPAARSDSDSELFVDGGLSTLRVRIDQGPGIPVRTTSFETTPHVAVGVRRAVSERSDLGARAELDQADGHTLLGVRAIDYRYRFENPLALNVFIGAARYSLATPAYGIYYGMGLQWRNVLPQWDLGADLRYAKKIARDHLLPGDPQSTQPDSFYDMRGTTLSLTRRF